MFSVPHLIIIFVVVLIVFGPEKLPDLARNLGKIMGEFRRATGDLRLTFDEHMRDIEREANMRAARMDGGACEFIWRRDRGDVCDGDGWRYAGGIREHESRRRKYISRGERF